MEQQFLDWIARHTPSHPALKIGIGDDGAVLHWPRGDDIVIATDAITDQIDFRLEETDPKLIGRKALAVNLSDLAAMAAEPVAALVSLVLPRSGGAGLSCGRLAETIMEGMTPLAAQFDLAIAGGDTNTWDAPLVVSVSILGRATEHGPLTRSGGQVGDRLLVTGALGGSILRRQFEFQPRIAEAKSLHAKYEIHCGIDISDGLGIDASRLASASNVGIAIDLSAVPVSDDAVELSRQSGRSALSHALGDGEDFELLFTAPQAEAQRIVKEQPLLVPIACIGRCIREPGLWQRDSDGRRRRLEAVGYEH